MTVQKMTGSPDFLYLPLENIVVEEQIRSGIDIEGGSFKTLMKSIKNRGILEPVLVTPKDGKYLLLCGERRYLAASKLGMESIPAMVVDAITQHDEILAFQLTENLQREDLNPIDQAKGILAYIQAKHPNMEFNVDRVTSVLVTVMRSPDRASEDFAFNVNAIAEISGKSYPTLFRMISLLKNPVEIQEAIREGNLPVSQGYLFAANLDCPNMAKIFQDITKKPVTYLKLKKMLTAHKKVKSIKNDTKSISMTQQVANLRSIRSYIETGTITYTKPDFEMFLDELRSLISLVQKRVLTAPMPTPANNTSVRKPPPQV
ncbi:MAG: ParB/RepB/Spo0J family partition protein [Proteobacteria bacterium]|nr:ParB/RepB/Spo0J family partition protein [Pseudomonadota bacterium]